LVQRGRAGVAELTGLPQTTPDSKEWYAQMALLPIPRCNEAKLKNALYDYYRIEIPVSAFDGQEYVRLSVQAYNSERDIDTLVRALGELLPQMNAEEALVGQTIHNRNVPNLA